MIAKRLEPNYKKYIYRYWNFESPIFCHSETKERQYPAVEVISILNIRNSKTQIFLFHFCFFSFYQWSTPTINEVWGSIGKTKNRYWSSLMHISLNTNINTDVNKTDNLGIRMELTVQIIHLLLQVKFGWKQPADRHEFLNPLLKQEPRRFFNSLNDNETLRNHLILSCSSSCSV